MYTSLCNDVTVATLSTRGGRAACDPPKPSLAARDLLTEAQAAELRGTFKVLASETRLRLLHALERSGELRVSELAAAVGMAPQAVSNQLQRMGDRGIVAARREGSSVIYRVADPCVTALLELGLCLAEEAQEGRAAAA
jgi:ArsR family transcriptional regulator, lead/cadmium/zinc/bismuth-responsive transcriptional repressor